MIYENAAGSDDPGGVSYSVGILVFQGGDRDNVYAVRALVGGVTRDFEFSTREILSFQSVRFRLFNTTDFDFSTREISGFHYDKFCFCDKG